MRFLKYLWHYQEVRGLLLRLRQSPLQLFVGGNRQRRLRAIRQGAPGVLSASERSPICLGVCARVCVREELTCLRSFPWRTMSFQKSSISFAISGLRCVGGSVQTNTKRNMNFK